MNSGGCIPKSGRITALKPQVKNRHRTSVFIEGEYAFGIWTELVLRHELRVGLELSEQDLLDLFESETSLKGRATALRYLAYAPRTEHQIREHLRRKNYSGEEINCIVHDLENHGYIDDTKYAFEYAAARFKNKSYSPDRIRRELAEDGIAQECITEAIAAGIQSDALFAAAKKLVERFQVRVRGSLPERKKKLVDYLVRRGYEYSLAHELVQEVLSQSRSDEKSR